MPTPLIERPVRDCACSKARHVHGTAQAYTNDRCRCPLCSEAQRISQKRRRLHGVDTIIDATPTRERLNDLVAREGVTYAIISEHTGRSATYLATIARGERTQVLTSTARLVAALDPDSIAAPLYVDARSVSLRLQALVAVGWSLRRLSAQTGVDTDTIGPIANGKVAHITTRTDRLIAAGYERLWEGPPSAHDRFEQCGITRSITTAAKRGWRVPMDIEDDLQALDALKGRARR